MIKKLFFFSLIIILSNSVFSQNSLQVRYEYDAIGNAIFYADNYSNVPAYVSLDFSYLDYASFSEELPYIKRVEPGTAQLFTIYREPEQPSPDFSIEYKWYISNPSPKADLHFPYLIPAESGTSVKIENSTQGRMVVFSMLDSENIFAARKGIVINLFENADSRFPDEDSKKQNFIHILHDDGTVGEYVNFKYKGIDCEIGQKVIPGQKLGVAEKVSGELPLIGFSVFYNDLYSGNYKYIIPEFLQENEKVSQLTVNSEYKVIHQDEVIIKELSRREQRALKKGR